MCVFHPADPLGCLNVGRWGQRVRVVQRCQLDFDHIGQDLGVTVEKTCSTIGTETTHGRARRVNRFRGSLRDGQSVFGVPRPGDHRRAGTPLAIGAMAQRNVFWLASQLIANGATVASSGVRHGVDPLFIVCRPNRRGEIQHAPIIRLQQANWSCLNDRV